MGLCHQSSGVSPKLTPRLHRRRPQASEADAPAATQSPTRHASASYSGQPGRPLSAPRENDSRGRRAFNVHKHGVWAQSGAASTEFQSSEPWQVMQNLHGKENLAPKQRFKVREEKESPFTYSRAVLDNLLGRTAAASHATRTRLHPQ